MAQDGPYAARVVPNGQIYRQLFDAQLQLNQSLSRFDSESRIQRIKSRQRSNSQSLPTQNLKDKNNEIINFRESIIWDDGFSNDPCAEDTNQRASLNKKCQHAESILAGREVRCLPDVIVSTKHNSDIIERVVKCRKQKHESAFEDMQQALCLISSEIEPLIEAATSELLGKLALSDKEIANIQTKLENDFVSYKSPELFSLWEKIQEHTAVRKNYILEMDSSLKKIENFRMNKIRTVFTSYGKKFQSIGHLLLPDLERLMDRESQKINQTVLSNHRIYADLCVRLMAADIERERKHRIAFLKKVENWENLNIQMIVDNFKEFMQADAVIRLPGVEAVLKNLASEEKVLNAQRLQVLKTLCDMKPPNSTNMAVKRCKQDVLRLTEEIDCVMQTYLSKLHKEYEQVCQQYLAKVDSMKQVMINAGICSSHKANHIIDEFMLPLLGKQQRVFENDIESVQRTTEEHRLKVDKKIIELFMFAEAAAQLWDMHQSALDRLEGELQDDLKKTREQHDTIFQEKEANLDIIMDKMRQEANELALKDSLVKALEMLEKIKESYEEFYFLQTGMFQIYPTNVVREVYNYEIAMLHFFGVSRALPPDNREEAVYESDDNDEDESKVEVSDQTQVDMNNAQDIESKTATPNIQHVVREIIRTSKGTEFYLLQGDVDTFEKDMEGTKADLDFEETYHSDITDQEETFTPEINSQKETFLTEINNQKETFTIEVREHDDICKDQVTDMLDLSQTIDIPDSLFLEIKNSIRLQFLEHLDEWSEQAMVKVNSIVAAKHEELNSELDLRLHLHHARPRRAELDIHNVRAAELVLHAERMTRQFSGTEQCLSELGLRFKAIGQEHSKLAKKFQEDIEAQEDIFTSATKSSRLMKLHSKIMEELDKFMSGVRTSLRQFRQQLDETLQTLRESNGRFIRSFRLFSDGGNFCPDEVALYRKKLDKISSMIDITEGSIMSDLEGLESKHLESATRTVGDFESKLKAHLNDLTFIESITHILSETQVKIKAEVAKCNMQSLQLDQVLNDLQNKVAACEKPQVDKEKITAAQLNNNLMNIFHSFIKRSQYLHCEKTLANDASGNTIINTTKAADETTVEKEAKGGITQEETTSKETLDPPASLIKNIFKCVELSKGKSLEGQSSQANIKGFTLNTEFKVENSGCDKKSVMQKLSTGSDSGKNIQKGIDTTKEVPVNKLFLGRLSKIIKSDKKSIGHLDAHLENNDVKPDDLNFLVVIQQILKDALEGLFAIAEVFYNQKGTRLTTRPQAIPESFEQCTEIMLQKAQSYFSQSDEYQNKCLQDFHGQVARLEQLCTCVPNLVITDLLNKEIHHSNESQNELSKRFDVTLCNFADSQKSIHKQLRTTLGHPQHAENLTALCAQENELHNEYVKAVTQHIKDRQDCILEHARCFLDRLVKSVELQLQQYDSLLTVADIEKGQLEPIQHPLCELLRGHKVEKPSQIQGKKDFLTRQQALWVGVPSNQFVVGDRPDVLEVTPSVQTSKATTAHYAIVKARDKAYEDYKDYFENSLNQIEAMRKKLITSETNWNKSWEASVKKVMSLYQQGE